MLQWGSIILPFDAMAAEGTGSGAAMSFAGVPTPLAAPAADGAGSGAATSFAGAPAPLAALAADSAGSGAALAFAGAPAPLAADGGAAAGLDGALEILADEAPEVTSADAALPQASEAPRTPPLRPRGPFTDEEWERRQGMKRRAERDAAHALAPLQKWMVEETMQRYQQHETLEFLKMRLQSTTAALESMEREIKQLRTGPAAASDEGE